MVQVIAGIGAAVAITLAASHPNHWLVPILAGVLLFLALSYVSIYVVYRVRSGDADEDQKMTVTHREGDSPVPMLRDNKHFHVGTAGTVVPYERPATMPDSSGLIVCAGGDYVAPAAALITVLREKFKSRIPIAVFHAGDELTVVDRKVLRNANEHLVGAPKLRFIDVYEYRAFRKVGARGYQIKAMAIYLSPFRHTILMDADACPMCDPADLLKKTDYTEHGCLMFADFGATRGRFLDEKTVERFTGKRYLMPGVTLDSSMVLIDRWRHWYAMAAALHVNLHHRWTYGYLLGDKDTYWLCMASMGDRFNVASAVAGAVTIEGTSCQGVDVHTQRLPDGTFTHVNRLTATHLRRILRYQEDKLQYVPRATLLPWYRFLSFTYVNWAPCAIEADVEHAEPIDNAPIYQYYSALEWYEKLRADWNEHGLQEPDA